MDYTVWIKNTLLFISCVVLFLRYFQNPFFSSDEENNSTCILGISWGLN